MPPPPRPGWAVTSESSLLINLTLRIARRLPASLSTWTGATSSCRWVKARLQGFPPLTRDSEWHIPEWHGMCHSGLGIGMPLNVWVGIENLSRGGAGAAVSLEGLPSLRSDLWSRPLRPQLSNYKIKTKKEHIHFGSDWGEVPAISKGSRPSSDHVPLGSGK